VLFAATQPCWPTLAHVRGAREADPRGLACATLATSTVSSESEDDALILAVASGDAGAYRALCARYLTPIVRYASRLLSDPHEAEDVAQETFLRLWQGAARYEPRGHKPSTWLFRIAHNLCVDRLRKRRPVASESPDEREGGERPSGELARKELARTVKAALDALPDRQRAAIALIHDEAMSHTEAAQVLGCGVEAVESLLSRARRTLRTTLAAAAAEHRGDET
jgi:RNA polymerase sigma-70 factor (ECF subfamily)